MDEKFNLRVKVVDRIEKIPEDQWNSVFPNVLEGWRFFKTLDESFSDQFSFFYILIYDGDTPIGATSCFFMRFPLDMAVKGPLKTFFNFIKKVLPNVLNPKVLMCGLPMGPGRIGIVKDSSRVMEAICVCLEKQAKENKAALIIFKDFTSAYDDMFRPLLLRGFTKLESFPSTEMDISFNSFEEYLKTLSPVSRDGLKRNFKKVDGKVRIDLEIKDTLEDNVLSEIYDLYMQTYNKQSMGFEKLPMSFFKNSFLNMPGEVKYFLWRIDTRLAAFAFCLVRGEHFIDYYLGFDYSLDKKYYLYFVRFRDLLKWCINNGIKKYEMGVTTYEPKRRLGFNFVRFYFYMKHRNKLYNKFFGLGSYFLKPVKFDPVFEHMNK